MPHHPAEPLTIDPAPQFDLSPYLFMQFMEPLGVTDGSVAAAWDQLRDRWREDVVAATRRLAPALTFAPPRRALPASGRWEFPPASVSVVELKVAPR